MDYEGALPEAEQTKASHEAEMAFRRLLESTGMGPLPRGKRDPIIVWFRQDLRLQDNTALSNAAATGRPVIPVYLHVPAEEEGWALGGAARYWLHQSLSSLSASLAGEFGSHIVVRKGDSSVNLLLDLIMETGASDIWFNRVYEPYKVKRDADLSEMLLENGIGVRSFKAVVLYEPLEVTPDSDDGILHGFGSVGFFLRACEGIQIERPLPAPPKLRSPSDWVPSLQISDLGLNRMPVRNDGTSVDWAHGIREFWKFGEHGAHEALRAFVREGAYHFESKERFRADRKYTAAISPFVRFGELSPRTVHWAIVDAHGTHRAKTFLRRLAWRDLAYWCFWRFPWLADRPIRAHYEHQRWDYDEDLLKKWQRGRTGFPLVDAAMRQLWTVGWMPNYMRHVVAGFLIEHMNMHWVEGERWFHDTLVDADVAIQGFMWQNGGHSGFDQWNFVMHPVYAAKSCDPDGDFVRKWVPELAKLPSEYIHCPWEAPTTLLVACGVSIGRNYSARCIVDLDAARKASLNAVLAVRRGAGKRNVLQDGHEGMRLPDGRLVRLITRIDFREMSEVPLTKQTPDESRDPSRRPRKDVMSVALTDSVGAFERMSAFC